MLDTQTGCVLTSRRSSHAESTSIRPSLTLTSKNKPSAVSGLLSLTNFSSLKLTVYLHQKLGLTLSLSKRSRRPSPLQCARTATRCTSILPARPSLSKEFVSRAKEMTLAARIAINKSSLKAGTSDASSSAISTYARIASILGKLCL